MREEGLRTPAVLALPAFRPGRELTTPGKLGAEIDVERQRCDPLDLHAIVVELVAEEYLAGERHVGKVPGVGMDLVLITHSGEEPPRLDGETARQAERLNVGLLDADRVLRSDRGDQRAAEQVVDVSGEGQLRLADA